MPRIADFVVIQDHASTIPVEGGANDVHFPPFDAPNLSSGPAILAFRLQTVGDVELQAVLNGRNLFVKVFKTEPERSWHEVISTPGLIRSNDNDLVIAVLRGQAVISDIVLFYHALVS